MCLETAPPRVRAQLGEAFLKDLRALSEHGQAVLRLAASGRFQGSTGHILGVRHS